MIFLPFFLDIFKRHASHTHTHTLLKLVGCSVPCDNDEDQERLGVIVAHSHGLHGCVSCDAAQDAQGDERCYLCPQNPFYQVLLRGGNDQETATIVRIRPHVAFGSVVEVGACLLLQATAISEILSTFVLQVNTKSPCHLFMVCMASP